MDLFLAVWLSTSGLSYQSYDSHAPACAEMQGRKGAMLLRVAPSIVFPQGEPGYNGLVITATNSTWMPGNVVRQAVARIAVTRWTCRLQKREPEWTIEEVR